MAQCYNKFKLARNKGEVDLSSDTLKLALVVAHTPDFANDLGYSDVSADELVASGYTAGGKTLSNVSLAIDAYEDAVVLTADNPVWTALGASAPSHAILYDDTHASKILIGAFPLTEEATGGDYTVQFAAAGILAD